jgi:hypothetical protein
MSNLSGPTRAQWASLRRNRPIAEDQMATMPVTCDGANTILTLGIDTTGEIHFLVDVTGRPMSDLPPEFIGLQVRHRHFANGQFLDLCSPASHERVFTPFCCDLACAIVIEQRDPWAATISTIRNWQAAWKSPKSSMEKAVQVGLYGELWVLEIVLVPLLGPRAVELWSGPERERHDFVGRTLHIETKATRRDRLEFSISRIDQLVAPKDKRLLLAAIRIEESVAGLETIADPIDRIRDLIGNDGNADDLFLGKLAGLGWRDGLRRSGELLHFNLKDALFFAVERSFPRMPDDFSPPSGVVAVEYTIDLTNISAMNVEEVQTAIISM